ncbi:putative plastid-lipid-associated protein 12, chloroplastic [Capsicum annuum]|nr:putative plastid-lipid-associated protein 12, chloroplastic [Capsicum annuum]KAF3651145.1 putative plastid-lipid-associated protein 12, chloroplastic [Capsicum annuum]
MNSPEVVLLNISQERAKRYIEYGDVVALYLTHLVDEVDVVPSTEYEPHVGGESCPTFDKKLSEDLGDCDNLGFEENFAEAVIPHEPTFTENLSGGGTARSEDLGGGDVVSSIGKDLGGCGGGVSAIGGDLGDGGVAARGCGRARAASPQQLQASSHFYPQLLILSDIFCCFALLWLVLWRARIRLLVVTFTVIVRCSTALATIKDGKQILFQFDRETSSIKFLPFKVPYPVLFRLLGEEAKGWLDTIYLFPFGNLRISRGNKAIDEFISLNKNVVNSEMELLEGEWQMIWSSQVEIDSWIENADNVLMGMQIVKPNRQLKFLVGILFGIRFSMTGKYENVLKQWVDQGGA